MLKDCVKMYIGALCRFKPFELEVEPDADVVKAAAFITALTGKGQVSAQTGRVMVRPLKIHPAVDSALPITGMSESAFLLACGIQIQLELTVNYRKMKKLPDPKTLEQMKNVTNDLLCWSYLEKGLIVSCIIDSDNPIFEECIGIEEFGAGLLIGSVAARYDTIISKRIVNATPIYGFILEELKNEGIEIIELGNHYRIRSVHSSRFFARRSTLSEEDFEPICF